MAGPIPSRTLVLGLGNDLLADDAVGLLAARAMGPLAGGRAEVRASSLHGLALLDLFVGYDRAILVDAVRTGTHPPGTVLELAPADLPPLAGVPSPHFCGLPEMCALARQLEFDFPREFHILAVEIRDATTIGGAMTPEVTAAIPEVCRRVMEKLGA